MTSWRTVRAGVTTIEEEIRNWDEDMTAWELTPQQRAHHMRRLWKHHLKLTNLYLDRYNRTRRIEGWFGLAGLISLAVLLVVVVML